MPLIIKDTELEEVRFSAEELRLEIALLLYQMRRLSSGRASRFAGISRVAFQKELGKRKISVNYSVEDLDQDMKTMELK
jgi:predicted HTH domain antitoxin